MKPSWKFRRRAVFCSLVFAGLIIVYVLYKWDDTSLAQTTILSAFGLIGAIVASYIGGAVYEDTRTHNILARQAEEAAAVGDQTGETNVQ